MDVIDSRTSDLGSLNPAGYWNPETLGIIKLPEIVHCVNTVTISNGILNNSLSFDSHNRPFCVSEILTVELFKMSRQS